MTGSYEKTLAYIQGYNNLSGLSFTATTIGDGASQSNWTGLYVEPRSTGGSFTPSGATSNLDVSGITFAGTYGWQTTFQLPGANLLLGVPTDDSITGSASADAIRTFTGPIPSMPAAATTSSSTTCCRARKHTVDGG